MLRKGHRLLEHGPVIEVEHHPALDAAIARDLQKITPGEERAGLGRELEKPVHGAFSEAHRDAGAGPRRTRMLV